jgi:HAD superfamily hydrolase (TIGR01549 family)
MDRRIKAVLFDLGQTVLEFGKVDTMAVFRQAATNSYDYLKELGQPVGGFKAYKLRNLLSIRLKVLISDLTRRDWDSLAALKHGGERKGIHVTDEQWRQLNWKWYEPLAGIASVEPDLAETLGLLREMDLKLGIVSNTWVNGCALDRHLDMEGLLDFFDVRVYSYDYSFRKPDKRIFLEAARQVDAACGNILFVGDRVNNDVRGALRAGMIPVLKTTPENKRKTLSPTTTRIDKLSKLPQLIEKLNADNT